MPAPPGQHGFTRVDEDATPASWVACLDTLHREPFYREYKVHRWESLSDEAVADGSFLWSVSFFITSGRTPSP